MSAPLTMCRTNGFCSCHLLLRGPHHRSCGVESPKRTCTRAGSGRGRGPARTLRKGHLGRRRAPAAPRFGRPRPGGRVMPARFPAYRQGATARPGCFLGGHEGRGGRERGGPARRGPRRLLGPRAPQAVPAPPAPALDEPPAPSHLELPHQPQKLQQVPGPAARQGCSGGRSHATSDPDRAEQAAWLPPEAPPPPLSSSFPSGSSFSPFVSTTSLPWFSQPPLSCVAPSGLGGRPLSIVPSTAETVLVPY